MSAEEIQLDRYKKFRTLVSTGLWLSTGFVVAVWVCAGLPQFRTLVSTGCGCLCVLAGLPPHCEHGQPCELQQVPARWRALAVAWPAGALGPHRRGLRGMETEPQLVGHLPAALSHAVGTKASLLLLLLLLLLPAADPPLCPC